MGYRKATARLLWARRAEPGLQPRSVRHGKAGTIDMIDTMAPPTPVVLRVVLMKGGLQNLGEACEMPGQVMVDLWERLCGAKIHERLLQEGCEWHSLHSCRRLFLCQCVVNHSCKTGCVLTWWHSGRGQLDFLAAPSFILLICFQTFAGESKAPLPLAESLSILANRCIPSGMATNWSRATRKKKPINEICLPTWRGG
jgi:hypothetical protein